jgi:type II secretory pathway component PulM
MKYDLRELFNFYQRLSPRERVLVGVAGGALIVVALYLLVWEPLVQGRVEMQRRIAAKEREILEIQRLRETYLDLLRQLEASQNVLAKVDKKFSLFSNIESTVSQVVSRDRIDSMTPDTKVIGDAYREESVRLKLSAISLEQLVDMMYRIEKGTHPLRVTRLEVKKRHNDRYSFDVNATVSMLHGVHSG